MQTGTITLQIDSRVEDIFLIGLAINRICAAIPFDDMSAYEMELCVVEAVNNVIEHAYDNQPGHPVCVVATFERDRLCFEVRDWGTSMDAARLGAPAMGKGVLEDGGRGLAIIRALMSEISYVSVDGMNVLTLTKQIPEGATTALSSS